MTMILISIELPPTWNPRSKKKENKNKKTMKIFELLWKRCFLYTANNGINDFLTKKKEGLSEKKRKLFYPGAWCSRFKRKICSNENKNIYTAVWILFFLPINYLASYLYNFICLIKKTHQNVDLPPCCYYYCTISIIQKLMLLVKKKKEKTLGCSYSKFFTA